MMIRSLVLAAGLLAGLQAQAATVYADDFNADVQGLNTTPTGWVVTNGTVDTIGTGYYDLQPGNGNYLDLDGTSNQGGTIEHDLFLTAGVTYTLSYWLAGNLRNAGTETVDVVFGGATDTVTPQANDNFSLHTLTFTPTTSGTYALTFDNLGGDNQGALLDNVSVTAVPEPASVALLLAGLGVVGVARRRRG